MVSDDALAPFSPATRAWSTGAFAAGQHALVVAPTGSGKTPAAFLWALHRLATERRAFLRTPPDILVTTPASPFLLLSSTARESLLGVRTVIVDEVHAVAGTKRGAHLALSLARLDAQLGKPAQRIGLSARRSGRSRR